MNPDRTLEGDWHPGRVPENVTLEEGAYLETTYSLLLCRSVEPDAMRIGKGTSIYLGTMFDLGPGGRVHIGRCTLINGARIQCEASVEIGDFCLISWNVLIMDCERLATDPVARRAALSLVSSRPGRLLERQVPGRPVRIRQNVWLGFDCCVLPGVEIGEGSVVGARSVVTRDVPPYTVVVGNPARPVRILEPGGPVPPEILALVAS